MPEWKEEIRKRLAAQAPPLRRGRSKKTPEARRRHRLGARLAAKRAAATGRLRDCLTVDRAASLVAITTSHEAWREPTVA